MVTALDVQLRQGAGEGRIYGSDFFFGELLAEVSFGALPCFLNFGLVDLLRWNGQVRQDDHRITRNFDQPRAKADDRN